MGPIVVAGVLIPEKDIEKLYKLGVRDSKQIQHKIKQLACYIREHYKYKIFPISARKISLAKNINNLEAQYICKLINWFPEADKIYIDSLTARPKTMMGYATLSDHKDKIIAEPKADENYIPVMCASIIAKDYSDKVMRFYREKWHCGSGEPSDPDTLKYLISSIENNTKRSHLIRYNWITYKRLEKYPKLRKKLLEIINNGKFHSTCLKGLYEKYGMVA